MFPKVHKTMEKLDYYIRFDIMKVKILIRRSLYEPQGENASTTTI